MSGPVFSDGDKAGSCTRRAALVIVAGLSACGGGGGGDSPPSDSPSPPSALNIRATSLVTQAGGSAIGLEAVLVGSSDPVLWSLSGPGRLTASTGAQVQYVPPPDGATRVATDVKVTASSRRLVQVLSIALQPAPGSPAPVPGTRWEVSSYPKRAFSDLQWIGGRFYLLTSAGGVLSSTDGIVWAPRFSSGGRLRSLALGHAGFVAVGERTVLTSADGEGWVKVSAPGLLDLFDVAAGNGVYVANGLGGLARSADGREWQSVGPSISRGRSVAFGAGRFVMSPNGVDVLTSTDGVTWTSQTLPGGAPSESSVAYGNGRFLLVTDGSHYTSSDAVMWTRRPAGSFTGFKLRFANGRFYLASDSARVIWSTVDGENWFEGFRTSTIWQLVGMAEHAGRTVVATELELSHRSEGGSFLSALPGPSSFIRGLTPVEDRIYAVTDDGRVLSSRDGRAWETKAEGIPAGFRSITHGRGLFVAASDGGPRAIYTSPDGAVWTGSDVGLFQARMSCVTFGDGLFVASGGRGEVMRSADGVTWELISTPVRVELTGVAYGAGRFVAGSVQGDLIASSDGRSWTVVAGMMGRLQAIAHGPQGFVAVAGWGSPGSGVIWTSTDGMNWTRRPHAESASLGAVAYGGGLYLATGDQGTILTSETGIDWQVHESGVTSSLLAAAVMPGRFVAAGGGGAVVISEQ